jgi:hypothetical protein
MENTETPNKVSHNFTLDSFSKSQQTMIATNQNTYGKSSSYWDRLMTRQVYTEEEVADIIRSGNYLS